MSAAEDRQKAARELGRIKKITRRLERIYPEMGMRLRLHERIYMRAVINSIAEYEEDAERYGL